MPDTLYFEDFETDQKFDLGSLVVSKEDIIEFASEFDPQPFHLDEEAGKTSLLGGLAASGWHTGGLVMRLLAQGLLNRSTCQGSPGVSRLKWMHPVFPNDTLFAEAVVLEKRELRSKPGLGLVTVRVNAHNQNGNQVLLWENAILFRKRENG
ncbi:MAG: MaoC family dehydratase [Roseibium sp.]